MRSKDFGKTGRKVSAIGMGTYYDPLWIASGFLGWRRGRAAKREALEAGLNAGITLIDTAEIYRSEQIVADAIKQRKRDDLFVATKVWSNHLRRDDLKKSFRASLNRLGLSYIDLYQVHFPNPRVALVETMAAMEELVEEGRLMHIGVSNFSIEQVEAANAALSKCRLSAVQLEYSLVNRQVEREILPYCEREEIALLAYYPLGHGTLAESPLVGPVASKRGRTRSQIALSWLTRQPNVFPIPRASSSRHVLEDAEAGEVELSAEDLAELDKAFPVIP